MTRNQSASVRWQELDILRGLAAVLMIVNHLEFTTLAPHQIDSGLLKILSLLSSFAPVLFFFVTGVGYGIQSSKPKANHWYIILNKVVVLFLADQLMHWSEGKWIGLDFLGFIGFSSLVLELVRSSKSPVAYCLTGFILVSLMRYLLMPGLQALGYEQQIWGWLKWIVGDAIPGISYPLSPWLAYPFAGYLVGVAAVRYQVAIQKRRWQVVYGLLFLGMVPAIAGIILLQHSSLFRWGSVAIGFYVVSFVILLIGLALSLTISGDHRLKIYQNALLMRGISSFAVVPVHYFLIDLLLLLGVSGLVGSFNFYLLLAAILTTSFLLAHLVESCSQMIRQIQPQKLVWLCLVVTFLLMASLTLFWHPSTFFFVTLTRTIGQLVLCLLFVVRPPVLGTKAN